MASEIGIDIGGTFTDIVLHDGSTLRFAKTPSSPGAPANGVLRGLQELIAAGEILPEAVSRVIHGSTVATNALLEGTWARTALVTTRGFRDVLEIGRQNRPRILDPFYQRPRPVVSRDLRFDVGERLAWDGEEIEPLDRDDVLRLVPLLREAAVEAIAIVFLFSFVDPTHERDARELLSRELEVPIVISSDVLPEFREFERTSTTAVTAALRPVIGAYVSSLETGARRLGLPATWQIMQSSGAVTSARTAEEEPARVLLSGPAGGVEGARATGKLLGAKTLITMDMGGTSCDVSLIREGRIEWSTQGAVGGHPVALPMVEIHTIGAGGGSIGWVDAGGALRVGPQSAGAIPGPACYGRGGTDPTVTDAHVVLGHVPPRRPIGGLDALSLDAAREAVASVGARLGLGLEETALGMLEVSDAAMERAIRVISVERGQDPREATLVAFGGAGPLHAVAVARRLAIPRVIVPRCAGVLSAFGLLTADAGHDHSRSLLRGLRSLSEEEVEAVLEELRGAGRSRLLTEGVPEAAIRFRCTADLRYAGQSHELNIDLYEPGAEVVSIERLEERFHRAHAVRYGHDASEERIELVTLRVRTYAPSSLPETRDATGEESEEEHEAEAWFDSGGPARTRFGDRDRLAVGAAFEGPRVVLGTESTILIPPGARGEVDRFRNVILEVQ